MSDKIIKFEIVTPENHIVKELIKKAVVPTEEGEVTILPNHTPMVSILKSGVLEYEKDGGDTDVAFVSGGFLEVLRNKIVVLADVAERAEEIDELNVEEAKSKAETEMKEIKHVDMERFANISVKLERELARTKAVRRWKKIKNLK